MDIFKESSLQLWFLAPDWSLITNRAFIGSNPNVGSLSHRFTLKRFGLGNSRIDCLIVIILIDYLAKVQRSKWKQPMMLQKRRMSKVNLYWNYFQNFYMFWIFFTVSATQPQSFCVLVLRAPWIFWWPVSEQSDTIQNLMPSMPSWDCV